jgi:hypothetical protein
MRRAVDSGLARCAGRPTTRGLSVHQDIMNRAGLRHALVAGSEVPIGFRRFQPAGYWVSQILQHSEPPPLAERDAHHRRNVAAI